MGACSTMPESLMRVNWPEKLVNAPAVAVLERAIEQKRLSHSLLISGDDIEILSQIALAIADRLLNTDRSAKYLPPEQHPDCFTLRPSGKARIISADSTRELIDKVAVSSVLAAGKVGIIHECDRMHLAAANIFLKTLEEPPANTTLLLLTTRPYSLLSTILSRCLHFRFPGTDEAKIPNGWEAWREDYIAWLKKLTEGISGQKAVADAIFMLYGLLARFGNILEYSTKEQWDALKESLSPDISENERISIETGISRELRTRLFADIAHCTRHFALPLIKENRPSTRHAFIESIEALEKVSALMALNMNDSTALELFMLRSLRIWTRKQG